MGLGLWKVVVDGSHRLARGPVDEGPREFVRHGTSLPALLAEGGAALDEVLDGHGGDPVPDDVPLAPPITDELVWASGVTYGRSRDARKEESDDLDFYDLVYESERPELFVKSAASRVRGPGEAIAIRADSDWNVPEPELGVVASAAKEIMGYVIGNDVSSRSIEGENPLYLPQAKIFDGGCAIGPCLVPVSSAPKLDELVITMEIWRDGQIHSIDSVGIGEMRRDPSELIDWLFRAQAFPKGVVLLTGTGIVPDRAFTLQYGDEVQIAINGLGVLRNNVEIVGATVDSVGTS